VAEIVELGQAMRIPVSPVCDATTVVDCPQYRDREFFVDAGGDDWSFRRPGAPFRLSRTPVLPPRPAPRLGAEAPAEAPARSSDWRAGGASADPALPLAGITVLDLSTFWAGAYLTCYLGAFGADVVKVESIQRPDGHRYSGAWAYEGDRWYERSAMWQGTNLNKRDITLDLTSDRGRDLVRRLVRDADVVVENFSPRVIEQFGLDYESLAELKPDVILVRMPGFGLEGPWRDYVGWALNFEQTSGMAAATGYAEGPPCNLQGPADPIVGVHAGVALLAAVEHRRRTGEGQLIEVAQIEVAACVAAEPIIENSMHSVARPREIAAAVLYKVSTRPLRKTHGWRSAGVTTPTGRIWSRRSADRTCSAIRVWRRRRSVWLRTTKSIRSSPIGREPKRPQKSSTPLTHSMFRPSRC
jgi:crotonobetainyl-CoA:carnitine CoA-transferase CaiB-like acyl-CoA transferase